MRLSSSAVRVVLLLAALLLAGASAGTAPHATLMPGAETVRTGTSDGAPDAVELGPVEVSHGSGCGGFGEAGTYEGAYTLLKNRAVQAGANYAKITQQVPPHSENGCFVQAFVIRAILYREPPPSS